MSKKPPSKRYTPELEERAVRMVRDLRRGVPTTAAWSPERPVSSASDRAAAALRSRPRSTRRQGCLTTDEPKALAELRKEDRDLKCSNDIRQFVRGSHRDCLLASAFAVTPARSPPTQLACAWHRCLRRSRR